MMDKNVPASAQVATLLGIVSQLYTTRMNTLLAQHGFTLSQFALLNHLASHSKKQHSISELTDAMEINQPGVTKIVQKLGQEGLIAIERDSVDSRKRQVGISPAGREKLLSVNAALAPDVARWFEAWDKDDLGNFAQRLTKLADWLDTHRITD